MTNPSYKAKPQDTSVLLKKELRRRGMNDTEIASTLKKKKRRKLLEFNVVQSRRALPMPKASKRNHSKQSAQPSMPVVRESVGRISNDLCTVEVAATQLKVHNKTLLRFIRDGRLPATRVGKSYRIRRADLEAFAGLPPQEASSEQASLTSIVDIPNAYAEVAAKISRNIKDALNAKNGRSNSTRADVVYDVERSHLKIVVVGPPYEAVNLLSLIRIWMD